MDPYNKAAHATPADPFETSLTTIEQRYQALRAVKEAEKDLALVREREARAVGRAQACVVAAEAAARNLGAYELLPAHLRPPSRAAVGGAS
jgi:hypothetical protein